jgi:hypothetical protein
MQLPIHTVSSDWHMTPFATAHLLENMQKMLTKFTPHYFLYMQWPQLLKPQSSE